MHKAYRTTEIYLHSIDESARDAMTRIEGKFTSKANDTYPQPVPTSEKGQTHDA